MLALPARVPLNYASLFSGIGGFDIGFDRAGMRCVAQAEWDQAASEVLKHHWPNVTHLKDVRNVTRDSFRSIDVLCGGFPCQDVSVAGKRAGLDGERSGLWFEFYRIIKEHTPRWVVIENVPGLLTSNRGRDFAVIIDGLVKCGYRVAWRVLDAQYFGLAQRRKRVFIVASFGNGRCAEVLFEREGSTGNPEPRRAQGEGATADAPGSVTGYRFQSFGEYADTDHASNLKARNTKDNPDLVAYNITFYDANGRRQDRPNGGLYVNETEHSSTLTQGGIDHTAIVQAIDTRNSRSNGDISGTLQAKKSGGYSLNYTNPIAFTWHTGNRMTIENDMSPTLTNSDSHSPAVLETLQHKGYNKANETDNGGVSHASAQERNASTLLRELRQKTGTEDFAEWGLGILDSLQQAEVLQPCLHGGSIRQSTNETRPGMDDSTSPRQEVSTAGFMREMWITECQRRTSHRWELSEQQSNELGAYLSQLSQQGTSQTGALLNLWQACEGVRVLREALSTLQEIRQSITDKEKPAQPYYGVRRLTPNECEKLQGFPVGHTAVNGQSDSKRYKQLGNAVAVPVAEWIARRIVAADLAA